MHAKYAYKTGFKSTLRRMLVCVFWIILMLAWELPLLAIAADRFYYGTEFNTQLFEKIAFAAVALQLLVMLLYWLRIHMRKGDAPEAPKYLWLFRMAGVGISGWLFVFLYCLCKEKALLYLIAHGSAVRVKIKLIFIFLSGAGIGFPVLAKLFRKDAPVFRELWKQTLCFAAVFTVCLTAVLFDAFGVASYVPDTSEVASVTINDVSVTDAEGIADVVLLQRSILDESELLLSDYYHSVSDYYHSVAREEEAAAFDLPVTITITYRLTKGREVTRSYPVVVCDDSAGILEQYDKLTGKVLK